VALNWSAILAATLDDGAVTVIDVSIPPLPPTVSVAEPHTEPSHALTVADPVATARAAP
jgi:hypothetical protein